jgi:dTDP-4-dehydrorhamnose 3,5-epimerase
VKITPTNIPDVLLIEPVVFKDARGFFVETYRDSLLLEAGINYRFVQDNLSGSVGGVLRGLHYQIQQPQGKLVRASRGEIFDVSVDIRRSSPTFGKWVGIVLSEQNRQQLWIPAGFAHGYYVLSEWAEVIYKTTDYYAPQWERCILWSDPDLGIKWPLTNEHPLTLSGKDAKGTLLKHSEIYDQ